MKPPLLPSSARRRALRLVGALLAGFGPATAALAQPAWPSRPIRFIVPYPPGGGTDVVARMIAPHMAQGLGQTVVIDNKPGASTVLGTDLLAKAPPDGYTIGLYTTFDPTFFPKLPFDAFKDFAPITQLVALPLVLVARPSLNVKTLAELVALAKANPGKLNYASIGNGTPHQICMEWLKSMAGISMTHIPYKGVAPALNDLLAGQVDLMFTGTATLAQYTRSGKLVALGVASPKREPSFPDVPTIAEQNLPRYELTTLGFAIAAPAGTPRDIVVRLNQEIAAALAVPVIRDRLESMGTVATPSSLAEAPTLIGRAVSQWSRIIKESGVKLTPLN